MRNSITLSLVFIALLIFALTSRSYAQRMTCPGLEDSATVEQQAMCWFEADNRGDTRCEAKQGGVGACTLQSVAWCADAVLDDAAVSKVCFLSNIRAGQFEEALAIAEYLQTPSEEVQQCRRALSSIVIRIVSEPEGARIEVDGKQVGAAPVETTLGKAWWKNRVEAKFGSGEGSIEVVASGDRLMAAFDRRRCAMQVLVLRAPVKKEQATGLKTQKNKALVATEIGTMGKEPAGGVSAPGIALTAAGGAAVITGVILVAIAESNAASISSKTDGVGDSWKSVEGDYEDITPFRVGGWVSIGVGAVLAAVGVILLTDVFDEESDERGSLGLIDIANGGVSWRW